MDALTFLSAIVQSLAWPATVLILAILLRGPLAELIPLLRKLKWKELELEFKEKVAEVEATAIEVLPESSRPDFRDEETQRNIDLVTVSPRAAIIETWISVEAAARNAVKKTAFDAALPATAIQRRLRETEILDAETDKIFSELRNLRNKAAHHEDFVITQDEARRYTLVGMALARYINVKSNEK